MKRMRSKRAVSLLLTATLILLVGTSGDAAWAAKKGKKQTAKVSSVKITNGGKKLRLQKGKKFRLSTSVKVKPNKSKYKKLKFTSSNPKIVLVNSKGLLKGVKEGTAKVTVASKTNPGKRAAIMVSVTKDVLVTSIKLNKTKITVDEFNQEEISLKVKKILPTNAKNKKVKWSTSDEDVADVDDDGVVTTGDVGEAVIKAEAADQGGAYATCKVVVQENEDGSDDEDEEKETTPAPVMSKRPIETEKPAEKEKPAVTEEPEESGKPAVTEEPEESEKPEETEEPVETGGSVETKKPEETPWSTLVPTRKPVKTPTPTTVTPSCTTGKPSWKPVQSPEKQTDFDVLRATGTSIVPKQDMLGFIKVSSDTDTFTLDKTAGVLAGTFNANDKSVVIDLGAGMDISDYEGVEIRGVADGQIALELYSADFDMTKSKEYGDLQDWWEMSCGKAYPFYVGSCAWRYERGGMNHVRTVAEGFGWNGTRAKPTEETKRYSLNRLGVGGTGAWDNIRYIVIKTVQGPYLADPAKGGAYFDPRVVMEDRREFDYRITGLKFLKAPVLDTNARYMLDVEKNRAETDGAKASWYIDRLSDEKPAEKRLQAMNISDCRYLCVKVTGSGGVKAGLITEDKKLADTVEIGADDGTAADGDRWVYFSLAHMDKELLMKADAVSVETAEGMKVTGLFLTKGEIGYEATTTDSEGKKVPLTKVDVRKKAEGDGYDVKVVTEAEYGVEVAPAADASDAIPTRKPTSTPIVTPTQKPGETTPTQMPGTPRPTRSPKPPTALPKNSAVEAHKLGKSEEVTVNGKIDKPANGVEWENTTDKEIDLLVNKEVSLRGTSDITAAKAFLMWADEADNGENALYAIVKVAKPGTPGSSDKVTLFVSEDGTKVEKAEAVVGAAASENGAAVASKAEDLGGVDGYIAELKIPLSKTYAEADKLNIDIMITDGDATINYFDTMTEYELAKDINGNVIVDENNRNIAVPSGPDVSVDKNTSKMGDVTLIESMAAAAQAYYTGSGAAIRKIADYENNKWDWEIPAPPTEGEEAEEPVDNGMKSKAMTFVPTSFWTSVYEANGAESIAFPNVNDGSTGGYMMDGNITLADKNEDGSWKASREKLQSYVLWDEGYVYVLFDVNDPSITGLNDAGDWQSDSVEFFLDQDYSAPTSYGEAGTGDEIRFRVVAANNQFAGNEAGTGAYELVAHAVAYKKADGTYADAYDEEGVIGYQVEMIIKLQKDDVHTTPEDGDIMGMDFQVNDCYIKYQYDEVEDEFGDVQMVPIEDSGVITRAGTVTAFDKTNNCYQDPSCFGRVKLFVGAQGSEESPVIPSVDADIEARYTNKAITIDGELDSTWSNAPYLDIANVIPGASDGTTTARTKLLWDADNLYVLVVVKDTDIDATSVNNYERDGDEVFLDEDNSKEFTYADNADAFQYRFTGLSEDGSEAYAQEIVSGSDVAKKTYAGIESAYKVITSKDGVVAGYRIEHKIPWKNKAQIGKVVGFELAVFDCADGMRNRELYLINTADNPNAGHIWHDPSQMGTLKLVEAVAPLPWRADLSQIQIDPEDGSTMTVNEDGSVTIVNGGKTYTDYITLSMPAKFDGTPSKCTVYVDTFDKDGNKVSGGLVKWGDEKFTDPDGKYDSFSGIVGGAQKYNWNADVYSDTVLDMFPPDVPELPTTLVISFQDTDMTMKITKIVVE